MFWNKRENAVLAWELKTQMRGLKREGYNVYVMGCKLKSIMGGKSRLLIAVKKDFQLSFSKLESL